MPFLWDITVHQWVIGSWHFKSMQRPHLQGWEVPYPNDLEDESITFLCNIRIWLPTDAVSYFQTEFMLHCCKNLKTCKIVHLHHELQNEGTAYYFITILNYAQFIYLIQQYALSDFKPSWRFTVNTDPILGFLCTVWQLATLSMLQRDVLPPSSRLEFVGREGV
jgi:hypothetical protein